MQSVIYCNINLFDYDQEIYLVKDGDSHLIAKTPMQELGKVLPGLCYSKDVYTVYITAPVPEIAIQAMRKTEEEEMKQYSASKIEFREDF